MQQVPFPLFPTSAKDVATHGNFRSCIFLVAMCNELPLMSNERQEHA